MTFMKAETFTQKDRRPITDNVRNYKVLTSQILEFLGLGMIGK